MRMLFLGVTDEFGEYPVIWVDVDDLPCMGIEWPGLDVWLGYQDGLIASVQEYKSALNVAAKNNLGGLEAIEATGFEDGVDLDACDQDIQQRPLTLVPRETSAPASKTKSPEAAPRRADPSKPTPKRNPDRSKMGETQLFKGWIEAKEIDEEEDAQAFFAELTARFPQGAWRDSALKEAVDDENVALVTELLRLGADPNVKTDDPPIVMAGRSGNIELAKALLDGGASIEAKGFVADGTALIMACDQKHLEMVTFLLSRGADANAVDENEMAPIHHASEVFSERPSALFPVTVDIVRALLKHGATLDAADGNRRTALHWAVSNRNIPLIGFLLEQGANPDFTQWAGDTVTQLAWREGALDAYRLLRKANPRTDIKNKDGWCLDDFVAEDGVTPATFKVNVRLSEKPQRISVKLRFLAPNAHHFEGWTADIAIGGLVDFVAAGVGGSDVFAPAMGRAKWLTKPKKVPDGHSASLVFERECVAEVGGLSPAVFAVWLNHLGEVSNGMRLVGAEIEGEMALDASELSVDTERARRMLLGLEKPEIRAFAGAGPAWVEKASKDRAVAFVLKGKGPTESSLKALYQLIHWMDVRNQDWLSDVLPPLKTGNVLYLPTLGAARATRSESSLEQIKASCRNLAVFLSGRAQSVERVEWSLGVRLTQAAIEEYQTQFTGVDCLEVSPTNRATCRTCKKHIEKGVVRFAEGYELGARYHHPLCPLKYLSKRLAKALARYEGDFPEKQSLQAKLALSTSPQAQKTGAPGSTSMTQGATGATGATGAGSPELMYAERAKTARAHCLKCDLVIDKGALRIAVPRVIALPGGTVERPGYLHLVCAKGFEGLSLERVLGHSKGLSDVDRKTIQETLA